jgi:hypothetical protein
MVPALRALAHDVEGQSAWVPLLVEFFDRMRQLGVEPDPGHVCVLAALEDTPPSERRWLKARLRRLGYDVDFADGSIMFGPLDVPADGPPTA